MTEFSQEMKEHMYAVYEDNSCDMQTKLEELSGVLERCSQLNEDLLGARQALKGLSQGLALSLTPEQWHTVHGLAYLRAYLLCWWVVVDV